jgi:hypothetical protein
MTEKANSTLTEEILSTPGQTVAISEIKELSHEESELSAT